jgi:hypothetical protein
MARYQYRVTFIGRWGNEPGGAAWESFLAEQQNMLKAWSDAGWELHSTVPVVHSLAGDAMTGGVLFYWQAPASETGTRAEPV